MSATTGSSLSLIVLSLVAWLPYWILGLGCTLPLRRPSLDRIGLVIGCAAAGFFAELGFVTKVGASRAALAALLLAAASVLFHARGRWKAVGHATLEAFVLYLVAALVTVISPFPVLGQWGGDWLQHFQMGRALMGAELAAELLARPPLFGGSAVVLWRWFDGLEPFQFMSAAAAAGALGTALFAIETLTGERPSAKVSTPLVLSALFLHNTAAAWPKLLSASLVIVAGALALAAKRGRPSSEWFLVAGCSGLAVATHESALLWLPAIVLIGSSGGARRLLSNSASLVAGVLLFAGPFLVWILATHGLAAKVAASPALTDRTAQPFVTKTALVVVETFAAWAPVEVTLRWFRNPARGAVRELVKTGWWLWTAWIEAAAGSLVFAVLPAAVTLGTNRARELLARLAAPRLLLGIAVGVLSSAVLSPFSASIGSMQVGAVPLGLAAMTAVCWLGESLRSRVAVAFVLLQAGPWLLLNAGVLIGLAADPSFAARFSAGSEGDLVRLQAHDLVAAGVHGFPRVHLVLLGTLALSAIALRAQRTSPRPCVETGPDAPLPRETAAPGSGQAIER